jgi:hypothetical protein
LDEAKPLGRHAPYRKRTACKQQHVSEDAHKNTAMVLLLCLTRVTQYLDQGVQTALTPITVVNSTTANSIFSSQGFWFLPNIGERNELSVWRIWKSQSISPEFLIALDRIP